MSPRVKYLAPRGRTRLLLYLRVSTLSQAREGVSLGDQEAKLRAYAEVVDADVVDVLVDPGRSGKDLERPALLEALRRVEAGEADALAVYALDRLSRSTLDFLRVAARLRAAGRGFVSVREQLDTSTPHGRFTMTILAALAEMERELISARCREATARCRETRRVYGSTPYGWRRDGDRLYPEPAEVDVLERIRGYRADGFGFQRIADALNEAGIPPKRGRRWYASAVKSVLSTEDSLGMSG